MLRRVARVGLVLAAVLGMSLGGLHIARGQGGLTDEQRALIERVLAARDDYRAWTSFSEQVTGDQTRELVISFGAVTQTQSSTAHWERSADIIRQEAGRNISATIGATITDAQSRAGGENRSVSRSLNIEARLVDKVLYVRAAYGADTAASTDLPDLPAEWAVIDQLADWPGFQDTGLQDLIDDHSLFDDPDAVRNTVSDVAVEAGTLDDGTPVDVITIVFDRAGVQAVYAQQETNAVMQALIAGLDDSSGATVVIKLDADGHAREAATTTVLQVTGLDGTLLGAGNLPEGTQVNFQATLNGTQRFDQINAPLTPVEAPDMQRG